MHIGLIGGIGPAATDFYYRRLITAFAGRNPGLDLTIVHADAPTLLANLGAGDTAAQVAIYRHLTDRLARAGAAAVAITSIAGHFCVDRFADVSPLPVIDLLTAVNHALAGRRLAKVGILGTRTAMETRLYGRITGTEILPPRGAMCDAVHHAYAEMAVAGHVTPAQRTVFDAAARQLLDAGAEAILLGGTDLALVYGDDAAFPVIDCAAIHVDALVASVFAGTNGASAIAS